MTTDLTELQCGLAWRRVAIAVLVLGAVVLLTCVDFDIGADGRPRYDAMVELAEHGRLLSMKYSYLVSVAGLPLYWLGKAVGHAKAVASRLNAVIFLLGIAGILWYLRGDAARDARLRFCLLLMAASMFINRVSYFYGDVLTAVFVMLGAIMLARERRVAGWLLIILGTVNTPPCVAGLGLLCIYEAWRRKHLAPLAPVLIAAGLILIDRHLATSRWFVTGYEGPTEAGIKTFMPYSARPGFSYPFVFGVLSTLFSFGKGIIFFAPGLFLSADLFSRGTSPTFRKASRLWLWYLAGLVLIYSKWWAWYGGWAWGPRFFLLASVPGSLALALRISSAPRNLLSTTATLLVLLFSAWVGISGVLYPQLEMGMLRFNDFAFESLTWYTPEYSVLGRPFVKWSAMTWREWTIGAYCVLAVTVAAGPWLVAAFGVMMQSCRAAIDRARSGPRWRF